MATNPPIGNSFHEGPLGVVKLTFDGLDLGLTVDDTEIEFVQDWKEVFAAQNGTQPNDIIPTGAAFRVKAKIYDMTPEKMEKLVNGTTLSAGGKSIASGRNLYISGKDSIAKVLIIARVDSAGVASTDPYYILNCYKALPMLTGNEVFGPDTQKAFELDFYIFYDETNEVYAYSGYATSLGIIPV